MSRTSVAVALVLALAPHASAAGDPAEPTVVRVPLGSSRTISLRTRKTIERVLNSRGQLLWSVRYKLNGDGQVVDQILRVTDDEAKEDPAGFVQPTAEPNTVRMMSRALGSALYTVVDVDGKKESFRIDVYRSGTLLVGRSVRFQMIPPRKLKQVTAENAKVLEGNISPLNDRTAVITATGAGVSLLTLIGEDGTREKLEFESVSEVAKPGERTIVLGIRETYTLAMTGRQELQAAINENDAIVVVQPALDIQSVRLSAVNPGVSRIELKSTTGKTEQMRVIVTGPRRFLLVGHTFRITNEVPVKEIKLPDDKRVEAVVDSKDATIVAVKAHEPGDTRVTLIGTDGGRDVIDFQLFSDKPGKGRLVVPQFASRPLKTTDGGDITTTMVTGHDRFAVLAVENKLPVVKGLRPGVTFISLTSSKGKTEQLEIVVVEPAGKVERVKEPLHVTIGQEFKWKDVSGRNHHRFFIEDEEILTLDVGEDPVFRALKKGTTALSYVRDDEGNRDVVEVIVSEKKK